MERMERMMKRISAILVLVMMFSLMPQMTPTVFAEGSSTTIDVNDTNPTASPAGVTFSSNKFIIGIDANNSTITVTGESTVNTIEVAAGVTGLTLVLSGASITSSLISPINLLGTANVTVELAAGTTNILNASGASEKAGLGTNGTATVNITGIGSLTVIGGQFGAGIGGGNFSKGGIINIKDGNVTATGGNSGAGIGGGSSSAGGDIAISGGIVKATGGAYGAGIGGGSNGAGGDITISGGAITATGGVYGAGIGGGSGKAGGTINIYGSSNITAIGGYNGAGIGGGGSGGTGGTITIGALAVVMAASNGNNSAIQAISGSSGSAINAILSTAISASLKTYLKCGENILPLPATYKGFEFSAATASAVGVYSDSDCTIKIHNIVTSVGAIDIPLSINIYDTPTSVTTAIPLTGTVGLTINQATGQVTALATGGNTSSAGALYYTWTGGATGTSTSAIPTLGAAATCTVTKAGISGSIQATTTVYKVTVTEAGATGTDDASTTNASINKEYGKVGDEINIYYTLDGTGTLNNTLTYSGGASNPAIVSTSAVSTPITGASIYTIASADASSGTIALTATFAHTNATTPDTGGSGTSHSSGATTLINGVAVNIGTSKDTIVAGKTITTVMLDEGKLDQLLDQLLEQMVGAEGDQAKVIIPIKSNSDVQVCELNGQILSNLDDKQAILEIKTDTETYTLPAQAIDMEGILEQLGAGILLKDIKVTIEIAKASEATALLVENAAKEGEFTIIAPPVEFRINVSYGEKTIEVKAFDNYVERGIAIPEGVDPSKITTGIIINPDGTQRHVPTKVVIIDGKYYAKINSLTNSIYSVIWNPVEFSDVENHWAKDAVNEMGSRMVISGVGEGIFEPNRGITRAEFATIMIRSLGLQPGTGNNIFTDVKAADWYLPYIETAYEVGILSGYSQEQFGPMDQITREQAMTMVARAMKITGLNVELDTNEAEKLLADFGDGQEASNWSKESMAKCLKAGIVSGKSQVELAPKDQITRAEVTVIVKRLLEKSNLI